MLWTPTRAFGTYRAGFMQSYGYGFPRRLLLGNTVNKARLWKGPGMKVPSPAARSYPSLLVPSHNLYLTDDLAVAHLHGLRGEYTLSIWIFAGYVKCEAVFAYDFVLNSML
jgi:hypothetical protein